LYSRLGIRDDDVATQLRLLVQAMRPEEKARWAWVKNIDDLWAALQQSDVPTPLSRSIASVGPAAATVLINAVESAPIPPRTSTAPPSRTWSREPTPTRAGRDASEALSAGQGRTPSMAQPLPAPVPLRSTSDWARRVTPREHRPPSSPPRPVMPRDLATVCRNHLAGRCSQPQEPCPMRRLHLPKDEANKHCVSFALSGRCDSGDVCTRKHLIRPDRILVRSPPRVGTPGRRGCFNCGSTGHFQNDCPAVCSVCRQSGHTSRDCVGRNFRRGQGK
jgi:hypothetical protein